MKISEELVNQFVSLYKAGPGGCYGVRLSAPGIPPVVIGRTSNPAVAREWVLATRRFLEAAMQTARNGAGVEELPDSYLTDLPELSTDGNEGRLASLPG